MTNFWEELPKPIFCLAPMEEVTDFAFREMFARYSGTRAPALFSPAKPDLKKRLWPISSLFFSGIAQCSVATPRNILKKCLELGSTRKFRSNGGFNQFVMYTEFINVDGLTHPEGRKNLQIDLKYSENQRPIVAQLWGTNPEKFYEAAKIIADLKFDGIDINMGCPQQKEIGIGACAALIRDPNLAKEIIAAVKKGAGELPVSVKTRIGYSKPEVDEWIGMLLGQNLSALAIHARTKQDMSKVPAKWEYVAKSVALRDQMGSKTLILGNGDVKTPKEMLERVAQTGCDGVMVGRGAFGHPWFFKFGGEYLPSVKERLVVMLEHAELFNKELGESKSFMIMRKHFKAYANGFAGAHELRVKLMEAKNLEETKSIVEEYLKTASA